MTEQFIRHGGTHILYDAAAAPRFDPAWFDRAAPADTVAGERETWSGREPALFFKRDGEEFVLKHYRRGGWLGRLVRETYCYAGEAAVRSFHEWRLLAELQRLSLPAPVPCAARYCRCGLFYTADLITFRLRARPLSQWLTEARLSAGRWRAIGAVLRRFHDAGVYHADLNAHNILLGDTAEAVFLLDFDKARIIKGAGISRFTANLERLQRSLLKLRAQSLACVYGDEDFSKLAEGYYSG